MCPDDYSPHDDCVTLDQLLSADLIKSNTTFKFVSTTFEMKRDLMIRFENVSNIILESASPQRAIIFCVGENTGFVFISVSGLAVQNLQFINCGTSMEVAVDTLHYSQKCTLGLVKSSNVTLQNLEFKEGMGVFAAHLHGNVAIISNKFTHMNYTCLHFFAFSKPQPLSQCNVTVIDTMQC